MRVLKNRSDLASCPVTITELVFMLCFHRTVTLDRSIGSYAEKMNLSRETVRKYASSLLAKGMMTCHPAGRRRIFLISPLGMKTIREYLEVETPTKKDKPKKAKKPNKKGPVEN